MGFDAFGGRGGVVAGAFDYVGIERALCQEGNRTLLLLQALSLFLEDTNKLFSNDLAFLFWIDDIRQTGQETLACVNDNQGNVQVTTESINDLFPLSSTEQASIDKDTGQLIAYRFMHKQGCNGRINTTREATNDTLLADTLPNLLYSLLYDRASSPVRCAATDTKEKVADNFFALRSMCHFWVELQADNALCIADGSNGIALGASQHTKTIR